MKDIILVIIFWVAFISFVAFIQKKIREKKLKTIQTNDSFKSEPTTNHHMTELQKKGGGRRS